MKKKSVPKTKKNRKSCSNIIILTEFLDEVTRREGKKVSVNRAQVGEVWSRMCEVYWEWTCSERIYPEGMKAGVSLPVLLKTPFTIHEIYYTEKKPTAVGREKKMIGNTFENVLRKIQTERHVDYGGVYENLERVSKLFTVLTGLLISPREVSYLLTGLNKNKETKA